MVVSFSKKHCGFQFKFFCCFLKDKMFLFAHTSPMTDLKFIVSFLNTECPKFPHGQPRVRLLDSQLVDIDSVAFSLWQSSSIFGLAIVFGSFQHDRATDFFNTM